MMKRQCQGGQDRVNGPGHPSNPQQAANMRGRAPGGVGRDRGPQEQQPEQAVQEQEQDNQQEGAEEFTFKGSTHSDLVLSGTMTEHSRIKNSQERVQITYR